MGKMMSILEKYKLVEKEETKLSPTESSLDESTTVTSSEKETYTSTPIQEDVISSPIATEPDIPMPMSEEPSNEIPPEPPLYDHAINIEDVYKDSDLGHMVPTETVFLLENLINALPAELPEFVKKTTIDNIAKASAIDVDKLLTDGQCRNAHLEHFINDFTTSNLKDIANLKQEIEQLSALIANYHQQIKYRELLIQEETDLITAESHRISTILEFFKNVLKTAFDYNENLSFIEGYKLLTEKETKKFPVSFIYNEDAINDFVHRFTTLASCDSQNASLTISPSGKIERTADKSGVTIDQSAVIQSIYNLLTPEACLSELQEEAPKERTTITPLVVDVSPFSSSIAPAITKSSLDTVDTLVSSFSTSFTPGTGSDINIAIAAKNINGTLLMPGETFSYNEILGNTTLDKGYTYATVIVNSQPTKGVGGGVCQVSTTLYNAILHTGILPTERRPHSRPSSYVPLGLDATIDWGNIDFKFTNTQQYPLYIVAYTDSNKVYVDIYSNKDLLNTTYKFKSELLKTLPSTTKYIADSSLSKGTTQLVSKGSEGYQVKVSRETYTEGTLSETRVLYHDTYAAIPTVYKIGT